MEISSLLLAKLRYIFQQEMVSGQAKKVFTDVDLDVTGCHWDTPSKSYMTPPTQSIKILSKGPKISEGCSSVGRIRNKHAQGPEFNPRNHINQAGRHMPVIPAVRR